VKREITLLLPGEWNGDVGVEEALVRIDELATGRGRFVDLLWVDGDHAHGVPRIAGSRDFTAGLEGSLADRDDIVLASRGDAGGIRKLIRGGGRLCVRICTRI
jgi:hypothetical protein